MDLLKTYPVVIDDTTLRDGEPAMLHWKRW